MLVFSDSFGLSYFTNILEKTFSMKDVTKRMVKIIAGSILKKIGAVPDLRS